VLYVNAEHVAVLPVTAAPHVQPHIGTVLPSGRIVVCCEAVRFTVWADKRPAIKRRMVTASAAGLRVGLR
jgi:hypothetical protein